MKHGQKKTGMLYRYYILTHKNIPEKFQEKPSPAFVLQRMTPTYDINLISL
jgi:hypothetical protein